ncbi:hypothetical protein B0H19DRAFT_1376909 [Mycena capillaripes]|nr:hypothetical protein B0H19DRAFT_1376909 [Mycena capillaripes]
MPAPGLPIQELWEIIIDFFHESPMDLKSISLACRSFVYPAQSHIFRAISVPANHGHGHKQAKRLCAVMNSSPHINGYVQYLSLGTCQAEILIPLARIRWSRVHTLSLADTVVYPYNKFLRSVRKLVGIPSLRTLSIEGFMRFNAEQLHTLLSHCSAGLQNIALTHCNVHHPSNSITVEPPLLRPKIRKLTLISATVLEILTGAACAFDFTTLKDLTLMDLTLMDGPILDAFLRWTGPTVERLGVGAKGSDSLNLNSPELSLLPALVHIDYNGFGYSPVLNTMLRGVPTDNCITTIHLSSWSDVLERHQYATYIHDFDEVVTERLPALREVSLEMHITRPRWGQSDPFEFNHRGLIQAMEAALPRLHEKGMLSVHVRKLELELLVDVV